MCSSWTAGAWHHRRSLLPIHWPIEAGAAEQPPIPQFVSIQSRTGLPGLPQVWHFVYGTYPRPRDQPGHRLNQRPDRPDLSSIYILLVPTACLPGLLGYMPISSPPRHPSPKHLSRPPSRTSPRPAGFTVTSSATCLPTYQLYLLACFIACFIHSSRQSFTPTPFSCPSGALVRGGKGEHPSPLHPIEAGGRDSSTRRNTTPATSVSSILVPPDILVR